MAATREHYVFLAKLAEQAERYNDMATSIETLIKNFPNSELSVEERNLFSVAYKNMVGSLRAAWRIVSSIEQKEELKKNDEHVRRVREYRGRIEGELEGVCRRILGILEGSLVEGAKGSEGRVFYLKMKGDYFRYLAEFKVGDERKEAAEMTMEAYKAAQDIAFADLAPTHPIRLGLALNFSVFHFEILDQSERACSMAKQRSIILKTQPLILEAIQEVLSSKNISINKFNMADLGCSFGPNSLLPTSIVLDAVHESLSLSDRFTSLEFFAFLNDLPRNDFNSVFRTLPAFYDKIKEEKGDSFGPCFVSGTPGSFYGRLFPKDSLHFVYSANSLHWLSQVFVILWAFNMLRFISCIQFKRYVML